MQIGAGAIGRGFLGQLWSEGGYETIFVDVNETIVAELNHRGSYPLRLVTNDTEEIWRIAPVRAVLASDIGSVAAALASCSFAATAVGAGRLESVARALIAPSLAQRSRPLNVLLCENGLSVRDNFLAGTDNGNGVHGVETVVGRMVPEAGFGETDFLAVTAEPFRELPFDRSQWHGAMPDVPGLLPVVGNHFHAYELRKLFLHNGGHSLLAYYGYLRGHAAIRACAEDETIVTQLRGFWEEVGTALRRSDYREIPIFADGALKMFTEDLLHRFRNPHLGDTVLRVARDPLRKLSRSERFVGAALFCQQHGVEPAYVSRAIAAALHFQPQEDSGAAILQKSLRTIGVRATIVRYTGLDTDSPLTSLIEKEFTKQG